MTRLAQQIGFIKEIEALKAVTRYNMTLDQGRMENSAEHSWHIALMAMILFEHRGSLDVDLTKAMKMLLIHDFVEIGIGDTFLYDEVARESAYKKERVSLDRLVKQLPKDQGDEIVSLWLEFEERFTDTAKFSASLDALQPLLNHSVTAPVGRNPHQLTVKQVLEKKSFIKEYTPELWEAALETIEVCRDKGLFEG